jgi:hypothetical protein
MTRGDLPDEIDHLGDDCRRAVQGRGRRAGMGQHLAIGGDDGGA